MTYAIIFIIIITFIVLGKLFLIDLHTRLLPNKYVGLFLVSGLAFHPATQFTLTSPTNMLLGCFAGGGMLFAIRAVANKIYKADTLGLGDVKLMGAAGIWLGIEDVFLAISLGALIGLAHGVAYGFYLHRKTGEKTNFNTLSIPAGPGFIVGIVIVGIFKFQTLPLLFFI